MKSRFDFVNQILIEELYVKRLPALTSFKEGLDHFGLLKFVQMNPDTWRPFLWKMEDRVRIKIRVSIKVRVRIRVKFQIQKNTKLQKSKNSNSS
jgi:hypothetical protein